MAAQTQGPALRTTGCFVADRVRAVLITGGENRRIGGLSHGRSKPLVPFGGTCGLIDFSLVNAVASGLSDVLLIPQYEERQLMDDHRTWWRPALGPIRPRVPRGSRVPAGAPGRVAGAGHRRRTDPAGPVMFDMPESARRRSGGVVQSVLLRSWPAKATARALLQCALTSNTQNAATSTADPAAHVIKQSGRDRLGGIASGRGTLPAVRRAAPLRTLLEAVE